MLQASTSKSSSASLNVVWHSRPGLRPTVGIFQRTISTRADVNGARRSRQYHNSQGVGTPTRAGAPLSPWPGESCLLFVTATPAEVDKSRAQRFKSHPVVCHSDARPWHLGDRMPSDGRWRIVIFPGDIRKAPLRQQLEGLAAFLDSQDGPIRRYTGKGQEVDSVIQIFTLIGSPRIEVEPDAFPDILRPTFGPLRYRSTDFAFQGVSRC